ncbi:hypothetical protein [uncultured Fibrella sp.]|uniref:hypothetical protein n=1 Tax=uncultured Fibrella sp. TaxID=1284596 RepID=UPI0035CBED35
MTVHIDISSRQKITYFLEIVKSLDFVEHVRVDEETQPETTLQHSDKPSFSDQFYGSLKSGLTIEEIDHQLQTLRNEWDRPTWPIPLT